MTDVRIYVTYKESVFDPQGDTIKQAIHALGHDEVKDVKVGKFFDVTLDPSKKDIETAVKEVAEELLVNFNLETYHYEIMEEA
ncbi:MULTISPECIES: phosphoribosylformylglycinamidine synthase subunit PurS [Ligilactobacillus]|jgi:phosphoribosylformylglycinamidine synthase|uniref:Phosphoribosylformylglycinamidine synthase subunit PurS n=1 Tax=Ligilactobacillus murinus TaxID=1622 RepID=A0A2Z4W079_9LACO|nr:MULTISPECIES: phosphoribosylformylglycinamidine synthase subunit PurS [Ligilactobacillus]MDE7024119.1 phosphoribosylformylglycinamidine synthase subunit PurS [Ligilactobacillus sp.]NBH85713.1 phosphoribosylformylglycinamidine synthase subunit PurS [Lachnospiraceae bacterium]HAB50360.1 phosphoribosylformylglycinamidine synthase subunit PurS [Lactobacillus sp.]AWZ37797.1 phosphoribosylformylglycinamidine synthase [Ligilactobacillus murinus]AWZ41214.1 phosphoribosylformylglycinamidine synthase